MMGVEAGCSTDHPLISVSLPLLHHVAHLVWQQLSEIIIMDGMDPPLKLEVNVP